MRQMENNASNKENVFQINTTYITLKYVTYVLDAF